MAKRAPKYALHKASGQARVRIHGKDIYLGEYDSPESRAEYDRLMSKFFAKRIDEVDRESIYLSRLCIHYIEWARTYYVKNGRPTSEIHAIQLALRPLVKLYGKDYVSNFGPRKLILVREFMIEKQWARTTINQSIQRINRMFRWATENEYCDVSVYESCKAVTGLRYGRTTAKETGPVLPVPDEAIAAIEPHVSPIVWSMIQLQLVTGMRPGEVRIIRPCDVDRSQPVWEYRPCEHKTQHHGRERIIFIGPRGQQILAPYLTQCAGDTDYLFRADASEELRRSQLAAERKSKPTPSQMARQRKDEPKRTPGECYRRDSYTRAIARACKAAKIDPWSPNQLRHNAATNIRKQAGLEDARTVLGHSKADMTEVYAEVDFEKARRVMESIG